MYATESDLGHNSPDGGASSSVPPHGIATGGVGAVGLCVEVEVCLQVVRVTVFASQLAAIEAWNFHFSMGFHDCVRDLMLNTSMGLVQEDHTVAGSLTLAQR